MRRAPGLLLLLVLGLTGCAGPLAALTQRSALSTAAGPVVVRAVPGATSDVATIGRALKAAGEKLEQWGAMEVPIELYVLPSHQELERAVRRRGYGWLRAWAQYDTVFLQAPSTWTTSESDLSELLAHELTHCLMYQRAATRQDWVQKGIPLWFREGMATWTAQQGLRWMTLEDLAHAFARGPGSDPILDAEALYQSNSAAVYAAAHYAFGFLVRRYGHAGAERILERMKAGAGFDAAFAQAIGLSHATFIAEFRRYVLWRGFRGDGRQRTDAGAGSNGGRSLPSTTR